jgi:hypothetical protein
MRRNSRSQLGSGVFGTMFGLFVFLLLLLVAVNVVYALYARSMVTNAALDAARHVAGYAAATDRDSARDVEDAAFHDRIGLGDNARLEWSADDPDVVVVRVVAVPPSLMPRALGDIFGIGTTNREIRVRVERER